MASLFMRFLDHTQLDAPQSVGVPWTSDQLVTETSTRQRTTLKQTRAPGGIRTHNLSSPAAADRLFMFIFLYDRPDDDPIYEVETSCQTNRSPAVCCVLLQLLVHTVSVGPYKDWTFAFILTILRP